MSTELIAVLILLAAAIGMFALNKPRMDAVALIMLTLLPFVGVVTGGKPVVSMSEALAGFSDANVVLIAALFVIGDGLVRTGVARRLGDWLIARAGRNEVRLIALLMIVVCGLGATMSSTAVTAIFIPVGLRISQSTGVPSGRLMMPLSFAALISGMTTLIATAPNMVVSSELERSGFSGFGFFAFTPFGVPILVLAILYVIGVRRWLTRKPQAPPEACRRPTLQDWIEEYGLADRAFRFRVPAQSPLVGKTLEELELRRRYGLNVVAIERSQGPTKAVVSAALKSEIAADDVLLVDPYAGETNVKALQQDCTLEPLPLSGAFFSDYSQEIGMAEAMLPASSELIGKTLVEARFRSTFGLHVIGLRRGLHAHKGGFLNEPLQVGDTLLLIGRWKAIRRLAYRSSDLVLLNLPREIDEVLPVPGKALQAVLCLALVIGLMVSGVVPNVQAALIGCLLMGLLGCVDLQSAYRAIDWKTIVLIVGMLPFSLALQRTGGVDLAAEGLMALTSDAGPRVVLACLFAITAVLGMFISNTATAVLMAPVAIAVAKELQVSPYPFAMIVALAASTAFMTPVSSPVNTLVVTPGNYVFGDFVRIGVPFAIVVLVVSVLLVPLLLPL